MQQQTVEAACADDANIFGATLLNDRHCAAALEMCMRQQMNPPLLVIAVVSSNGNRKPVANTCACICAA